MEIKATLYLDFITNTDENFRLTIPRADAGITSSAAQTGMQGLILNQCLLGNGRPAAVKGCALVKQQITPLPVG